MHNKEPKLVPLPCPSRPHRWWRRAREGWRQRWGSHITCSFLAEHAEWKILWLNANMKWIKRRSPEHCQRLNGPKALSTLSHSIHLSQSRSVNIQQAWSNFRLVLLGEGHESHRKTLTNPRNVNPCSNFDKPMYQFRGIHASILTNQFNNLDKSMYPSLQIHITNHINPFITFDKSNLNKIQREQKMTH